MRRSETERDAEAVSEVARRAIRRLDIVEWVLLAGAGAVAIGGGWLVALLVAEPMGIGVRWAWVVLSLFLFGVPGAIVVIRQGRGERSSGAGPTTHEDDGADV